MSCNSAMAIKKQEFYEGAALHLLARAGAISGLQYVGPFFKINGQLLLLLKYSTRTRGPWGFTFTPDEQRSIQQYAAELPIVIALICGSDGVAALPYEAYTRIAVPKATAFRVSCHRNHGKHYGIKGPDGQLAEKVAPANWQKIFRGRQS